MTTTPLASTNIKQKTEQLYIVAGGLCGAPDGEFALQRDTFIAKKIPDSQIHLIATNNPWQAEKTYNYYVSEQDYTTVYNQDNGIVYLCLHNNANFRNDTEPGESRVSLEAPSHTTGRQTYSDGYTWLPLWKVDFTEYEYVTSTEIPVPDLSTEADYNTLAEKYEPLCGTGTGVTAFGCCCLYFKENSIDEITGEVYSAGDVTNEVIFSDCFECQKMADALDRDVLFLSGVTAGGITSSHPLENPLCPATKTIQTLQEKLQADVYNLIPGSSKEYQLELLNNHNETGLMVVNIDLSSLTDTQRTITQDNPYLTVSDVSGTGGVVQLKTNPIGLNSHYVYGVQLVTEGSGYGNLPILSGVNSTLINAINLFVYPENFYDNPELFTPVIKRKIETYLEESEISAAVNQTSIPKIAIMADAKLLSNGALPNYTKNDSTVFDLQTKVVVYRPDTIAVSILPINPALNHTATLGTLQTNTTSGYQYYTSSLRNSSIATPSDGSVYVGANTAKGYYIDISDSPNSIALSDILTISGITHSVYSITKPTLDVTTAKFYNFNSIASNPIVIKQTSQQTSKNRWYFNIDLAVTT